MNKGMNLRLKIYATTVLTVVIFMPLIFITLGSYSQLIHQLSFTYQRKQFHWKYVTITYIKDLELQQFFTTSFKLLWNLKTDPFTGPNYKIFFLSHNF